VSELDDDWEEKMVYEMVDELEEVLDDVLEVVSVLLLVHELDVL
jgi:hypothetical protein